MEIKVKTQDLYHCQFKDLNEFTDLHICPQRQMLTLQQYPVHRSYQCPGIRSPVRMVKPSREWKQSREYLSYLTQSPTTASDLILERYFHEQERSE